VYVVTGGGLVNGSALVSLNVAALRWARLVLGWITTRGFQSQSYRLPGQLSLAINSILLSVAFQMTSPLSTPVFHYISLHTTVSYCFITQLGLL